MKTTNAKNLYTTFNCRKTTQMTTNKGSTENISIQWNNMQPLQSLYRSILIHKKRCQQNKKIYYVTVCIDSQTVLLLRIYNSCYYYLWF